MWFKIRAQLIWWLSNRRKVRRECVELRQQVRQLRQELQDERARRWATERREMELAGKLDLVREEYHTSQELWRQAYEETLKWVGRVAFGFGVGDAIPKREAPPVDATLKGRVDPAKAIEEILKNAAAKFQSRPD